MLSGARDGTGRPSRLPCRSDGRTPDTREFRRCHRAPMDVTLDVPANTSRTTVGLDWMGRETGTLCRPGRHSFPPDACCRIKPCSSVSPRPCPHRTSPIGPKVLSLVRRHTGSVVPPLRRYSAPPLERQATGGIRDRGMGQDGRLVGRCARMCRRRRSVSTFELLNVLARVQPIAPEVGHPPIARKVLRTTPRCGSR
jgi:hypothetical protein